MGTLRDMLTASKKIHRAKNKAWNRKQQGEHEIKRNYTTDPKLNQRFCIMFETAAEHHRFQSEMKHENQRYRMQIT